MSKGGKNVIGELGEQRRDRRYNSGRFESDLERSQVTRDLNFKQRISVRQGEIMAVAKKEVITIPPTTTIMGAARTMVGYGYRRIPIADPGTRRIEGICTAVDIIDFLGGGDRSMIIDNKFDGSMILAINAPITEIMNEDVITIPDQSTMDEAIGILVERGIGGAPVVNNERKIVGIFTERDVVRYMGDAIAGKKVRDIMSPRVTTAPPETTIEKAARIMITSGFRRLPVTADRLVCGIITATDIMRYLGSGEAFKKLITGDFHEAVGAPISSIMTQDINTTNLDEDLGAVAHAMARNRVGSLPVISGGNLVGIITERDLLMSLKEAS